MKYRLGDKEITYTSDGKTIAGSEHILLKEAIDLTEGLPWAKDGFTIEPLFNDSVFPIFKSNTRNLLLSCWREAGLEPSADFALDQYHTIASSKERHLAAVEKTKLLPTEKFPVDIRLLEARISEVCKKNLHVLNPFDSQSVFHFRVIRPDSHDNNPLHRDVWLEDYSDCINLYIPIAGSNEHSSLSLIPESHWWPESMVERTEDGARINGIKFNVPATTKIKKTFTILRPNPRENEVLIFSPYLVHGGAVNLNKDKTRISIEIRLWKKN